MFEVWLGIRAGAVGLHPCSAKPRSVSHHLLGCGRLVRPVDSKGEPSREDLARAPLQRLTCLITTPAWAPPLAAAGALL
jgi:hypothetical protein